MQLSPSLSAMAGALAVMLFSLTPAKAQLVYNNGPLDGQDDSWTLQYGYVVTDAFTLSRSTTLTKTQIGLWLFPGDIPTSIDWSIGTTAYGSDVSSGTATALTNTFQFANSYGSFSFDIYETSFAISAAVGPGTYWLSLQNLVIPNGDAGFWDQLGPDGKSSRAYESIQGAIEPESFQLYGTVAVPEPGATALAGALGLTVAALLRRRRLSRQTAS